MIKSANDLISLIRMILKGDFQKLENPDYNEIYKLAKFHSIQNMLYYAILKYIEVYDCASSISPELLKMLSKENRTALAKTAAQEEERVQISKEFEKAAIKYMFLKGSVIKYLYPSIDMRSMADIDIYFDDIKSAEVRKIFVSLGYDIEAYRKSNHDVYKKVPFMNIETHRDLMNESYWMHLYYKDFWPRLIKKEESEYEYEFSLEDYYIFMTAHAAKHFSVGGMGVRNVIDEYIYLTKYEDKLDFNYISEELNKLGLAKFEKNLRNIATYWFGEGKLDKEDEDIIKEMTKFIIDSGAYGTVSHSVLKDMMGAEAEENINASRFKYFFRRAFPSYYHMKNRNPILKKIPILLPWFYFTRLLKFVFVKNKNTRSAIKTVNNASAKEIQENKKLHDDIGA